MSASSTSPCAACKFLRRKCTQGCVFALYFPPDQPAKFANVHRVFGASNVAKLLNDLSPSQREDAVNSLAYEAEARLRDPVYGCVGYISILQQKLKEVQHDLYNAKRELTAYIGPAANVPFIAHSGLPLVGIHHHLEATSAMPPFGVPGMGMGMGMGLVTPGTSQYMVEAAVAAREQELIRSYEQQQHEFARINSGFDGGRGFNQMGGSGATFPVAGPPPSGLALAPAQGFSNMFHVQQQHQRAGTDEGKSGMGPSS